MCAGFNSGDQPTGRSGGSGLFFRYAEAVPARSGGAKDVEKSGQLAVEFGKKVGHRMPENGMETPLTIAETTAAAAIEVI